MILFTGLIYRRISALTHKKVDIQFGHAKSPTIYRETPNSIRFDMRVPVSVKMGGAHGGDVMFVAGSITLLHNRLVYVDVFGRSDQGNDFTSLNEQLNAIIDKMSELNPNNNHPTP